MASVDDLWRHPPGGFAAITSSSGTQPQPGVSGTRSCPFSKAGVSENSTASIGIRSTSTSKISRFGTTADQCKFMKVDR